MKKVTELFNAYDGFAGSPDQLRELCGILFEKNLIAYQEDSLEDALRGLLDSEVSGIYFSDTVDLFNWDFIDFGNINNQLSFEEFKNRLTQI